MIYLLPGYREKGRAVCLGKGFILDLEEKGLSKSELFLPLGVGKRCNQRKSIRAHPHGTLERTGKKVEPFYE